MGIVLAKTESPSDIKRCVSAIPHVPIVAMIESAHALLRKARYFASAVTER